MQKPEKPYLMVHGFSHSGNQKFKNFLQEHGANTLTEEIALKSCLGVIEDNLNEENSLSLTWELNPTCSNDGQTHEYQIDLDDLILEVIKNE